MTTDSLIYVVDDQADFRFLLQELFDRFLPDYPVHLLASGQALLAELAQACSLPGLILLDRHMPGLDGHQLLLHLKQHSTYKTVPVVMMRADASSSEIKGCYEAGANSFLQKQLDMEALKRMLTILCEYWLEMNQLPIAD